VPSRFQRFWSWLFPPRRSGLVPWTGLEVLIVFLLTEIVWGYMLVGPLVLLGDRIGRSGGDFSQLFQQDADSAAPRDSLSTPRLGLWVSLLCFPVNVATLLLIPRLLSNSRPYQMGLTTNRIGRNALLGVFACCLATYVILKLNQFVDTIYFEWVGAAPPVHSLTKLSRSDPALWEQALIVLGAVVIAPIWEELLYRGFLQRWLSQRWWGGALACSLAGGWALLTEWSAIANACSARDWMKLCIALQPLGFVLLLSPGILLGRLFRCPEAARAVYGTALLWAIRHSPSWPDPVALFFLGLPLGWLADRTRSLVGPIVFHALFNSVACVMMFWPEL
jgi:membrane protease YdiL (CAAX protease family)